jgi:hypothetical protein
MRAPEGHSVRDLQDFVFEGFQRQLSAPRQKAHTFYTWSNMSKVRYADAR